MKLLVDMNLSPRWVGLLGNSIRPILFHVMALASWLAEMERELTIERTRAALEVARQLGRIVESKHQMTDCKIESAKKLLANGVSPRDVAKIAGF